MICSRHPAFCGFYSSEQLTGLDSNSEQSCLAVWRSRDLCWGLWASRCSFCTWFAGAPSPQSMCALAIYQGLGKCLYSDLGAHALPGFLSQHSGSCASPELFPPPLHFLPPFGCPPVPSNSCSPCTYIFGPHCILVTCEEFSAISLLHHYRKLELSGLMFNLFIIENPPGARGPGKGKQYMRSGVRGVWASCFGNLLPLPKLLQPRLRPALSLERWIATVHSPPTSQGIRKSQFTVSSSCLLHRSNVYSLSRLNSNWKENKH